MRRVLPGVQNQNIARVDVGALRAGANQFDASAAMLAGAVRTHLDSLAFDGASAGRAYRADGDAIRSTLTRLAAAVSQWSRASAEVAAVLRVSADRYTDAELRGMARIG